MDPKNIKILVVDDEKIVRESLANWLIEDGYTTDKAVDAEEALKKMNKTRWDIFFLDIKMPGMDGIELQRRILKIDKEAIVIIITAYASVDTAVRALKDGAFDYITKPFDPDQLSHLVRNAVKQRRLSIENIELRDNLEAFIKPPEIVGISKHIQEIKQSIETVAPTNTTVMIRGESGTGKELVAKSIHSKSERRFAPMVTVNCGALSDSLLESELFGHEKGAFTGALYRRKGKLEIANGGTLFLDEIGTIGLKTQIDLLRSIEEKEFSRLGSNEVLQSDFRVICATNTNLEKAVKNMTFREDLYYRLQVYTIYIKPLRERPEDIPELANYFMRKYSTKMNKPIEGIETPALDFLMLHPWKGNVRELENAIESAMVVTEGPRLLKTDFTINRGLQIPVFNDSTTLSDVEKAHIFGVLEKQNWNITKTAKILGVDRVTVYKKIKKYDLKRPE
jgi:DNA-binding NtrC family response regulator